MQSPRTNKRKKYKGKEKTLPHETEGSKGDDNTKEEASPPRNKVQKTDDHDTKEAQRPRVSTKQDMRHMVSSTTRGSKPTPTLRQLLMDTGSVDDLLRGDTTWTDLAAKLKHTFSYVAPGYAELCTIYLRGKEVVPKATPNGEYLNAEYESDQVQVLSNFLTAFMDKNGQLGYINSREWFNNGPFIIGIDVNYYPDRSSAQEYTEFHKDTGGNNLFVNLIFDNEQKIEATEWFADFEEPSAERARWQSALLPPSHLKDLKNARDELRADPRYNQSNDISGGTSAGPRTFVSWVDDLVWHSSPGANQRFVYSREAALNAYKSLDEASRAAPANPTLSFSDPTLPYDIPGVELLGSIMDVPGTHLETWIKDQGLSPQDIDRMGPAAWQAVYSGDNGPKNYQEDVDRRSAEDVPWKLTGYVSVASAEDPRLGGDKITETPPKLSTRRRANSLDQADLLEARELNAGKPRSFIRTWVRILSSGSEEAKDAFPTT
jgi:hypothetical protein